MDNKNYEGSGSSKTDGNLETAEVVKRQDSNAKALAQANSSAPSYLLIVAMLEQLCSVYVSDRVKSQQVFKGKMSFQSLLF